jgi:hypothetical protein
MLILALLFARFRKYSAYLPVLSPSIAFFRALQYNYTERKRIVNTPWQIHSKIIGKIIGESKNEILYRYGKCK